MRLLLDTHVFLWFISGDPRLPARWVESIRDPGNEVFLSVVSLWEAAIKHRLGKLPLPQSPETYLPTQRSLHRIAGLSLDEASVGRLLSLPQAHRDPFDQMLACQAIEHDLAIVTAESAFEAYPAPLLGRT